MLGGDQASTTAVVSGMSMANSARAATKAGTRGLKIPPAAWTHAPASDPYTGHATAPGLA